MSSESQEKRQPEQVDIHVGGRVRLRRKALGMSQEQLADKLGLTFQQVQKYERGANRISASKLHKIAGAMGVGPAYFFEGLGGTDELPVADPQVAFFSLPGAADLAAAYAAIPSPTRRRNVLSLARDLAAEAEGAL